jgi:hypothetical protein
MIHVIPTTVGKMCWFKKKDSNMSRFIVSLKAVRFLLIGLVTGVIIGYGIGHYGTSRWPVSNLMGVLSQLGSFAVMAALLVLFVVGIIRLRSTNKGKDMGVVIFIFGAVGAAAMALIVILDLEFVPVLRSVLGSLFHVPQGNLFLAGGQSGTFYTVLLGLLIFIIFSKVILNYLLAYLGFKEIAKKPKKVRSLRAEESSKVGP